MKRPPSKSPPSVQPTQRRWWESTPILMLILGVAVLVTFADGLDGKLVLDNFSIVGRDTRIQQFTGQNLWLIFTRNYWWPTFESDLYRPLTTFSYLINYTLLDRPTPEQTLNSLDRNHDGKLSLNELPRRMQENFERLDADHDGVLSLDEIRGGAADIPTDSFHFVNVIIHWLNAWLVYLLVSRWLVHRMVALVVTLAFAVHPLTIEAVTNIIGRADLFAAMFMLIGLELHARCRGGSAIVALVRGIFAHEEDSGAALKAAAKLIFGRICLILTAVLAILSKESGVVLIALMLLSDLAQPLPAGAEGRLNRIKAWFRNVPWLNYACVVPSLVVLGVARYLLLKTSPVTHQLAIDNPMALTGFWTHEMTAIKVLGYYIKLTFWPSGLSCDYSFNQIPVFGWGFSAADIDGWIALAVVVLLTIAALYCWRRRPAIFFFLGFAFIVLLPTSNLVMTIGTIMGERFMYLPIVGLLGALASALEWAAARERFAAAFRSPRNVRLAGGAAAAVILALAVRTGVRNLDWYDNVSLWRSAVKVCPNSFKAYKGLATSLAAYPKELDECIRLAERALVLVDAERRPLEHSPNGLLCDLTRYYTSKGDRIRDAGSPTGAVEWYEKAEKTLQRAIEADHVVNAVARRGSLARGMKPEDYHDVGLAEIYDLQIRVCMRLKRYDDAQKAAAWLVRLRPGMSMPYVMWAEVCASDDHLDDAAVHLIQATILGNAPPQVPQSLQRLYGILQPGAAAIVRTDNGPTLNSSIPLVREHVNLAFQGLVKDLLASNYRAEARQMRDMATNKDYKCPESLFEGLEGLDDTPAKAS